ncbi:hypothetical protein DWF00_02110 [Bosea caraganae]|uniref:Uncharacterized protein n=1 Tax=Bosea caraganae TaxID=2763117 RepID=A0A370L2F2_9HYPH|nr:hypothetical protein DWE98_18275 [Bosea caraganae]RDJ30363.1 hypothetical protein DWF00_02110 [Bosea caraganae]
MGRRSIDAQHEEGAAAFARSLVPGGHRVAGRPAGAAFDFHHVTDIAQAAERDLRLLVDSSRFPAKAEFLAKTS